MSTTAYDHCRAMACNAVMFTYMLLASFPVVGEAERAAVMLVLDHIFTFNIKTGRIVLTRKEYEQAQGLFPQLLVLVSRHGLVFTIGKKPSVMDVGRIVQGIVEPLVGSLDTLGWAEVFMSEDDARQLLKLALPRLQARVDEWVCEQSDLDDFQSQPASSRDCPDSRTTHSTAPKPSGAWWTMDQEHTRAPVVSSSYIPMPLAHPPARIDTHSASQCYETSSYNQHLASVSAIKILTPAVEDPLVFERNSRARNTVWWTLHHQALLRSEDVANTLDSGCEVTPASLGRPSMSTVSLTARDIEDPPHSPSAPGNTSQPEPPAMDIYFPSSRPGEDNRHLSKTLKAPDCGDVWWKPLVTAKARPTSSSLRGVAQPESSPTSNRFSNMESHSASRDHSSGRSPVHLLPSLIEANVYRPDGLHHPRPTRAPALSRPIFSDIHIGHMADSGHPGSHSPSPHPPIHELDQESFESEALQSGATPSLHPSIAYRPWIDDSSSPSSPRDFSTSDLSLWMPSPAGSWGRQFSGSASSFGPTTPTDLTSPRWRDDHYLGDMCWAPEFDDASPAHDLRSRANIEVRKAKEATRCRKLKRKLKSVLSSVWNAYA